MWGAPPTNPRAAAGRCRVGCETSASGDGGEAGSGEKEGKRTFKDGQPVNIKVQTLVSSESQLQFDYYQLPFCQIVDLPENLGEALAGEKAPPKIVDLPENLGEALAGEKIVDLPENLGEALAGEN
ncbi:hypothetical protein T484DRAFT_1800338 [Baffinella frigidus]|nr:hypothetical protein T484DRAFT_1800338 [Cryptophyta sp. CCMP2293]